MREHGLDASRISALLDEAERRLEGEWLLVGEALAAIWFRPGRVTEDVDLIGLGGTNEERAALMDLARAVGLPIEAVNSAADYFVRRISGWRSELELLRQGPRVTIWRPTPTLFLLLKLARLSEQDLDDCLALLDLARRDALPLDVTRLRAALDGLDSVDDGALAERRRVLSVALQRF